MPSPQSTRSDQPQRTQRRLLPFVFLVSFVVTAFVASVAGQIPEPAVAGAQPGFDVASIRERGPEGPVSIAAYPGGRFEAINYTIQSLIVFAYNLQVVQLVGLPEWARTTRYDILARGFAPGAVRQLLAERLKLKMRKETRKIPIYRMVLARKDGTLGPHLRLSTHHATCTAWVEARQRGETPEKPANCPGERRVAPGSITGVSQFLFELWKNRLPALVGRPIEDHTGLIGWFDYELTFTPTGRGTDIAAPDAAFSDAPSLFTAIEEQLGLKLQSSEALMEVLVVDRVERPTEN